MMTEELLRELWGDDMARLRWRICRMFGVAPWSKKGQALSDEMCLEIAAHMVLDRREQQQMGFSESTGNPAFDQQRFLKLKGAGR